MGCKCCTAILPPAGDKRPYHENFEFHRRRFQEIAADFQPAGVRLALGFHAAEYLRRNQAFQFIHDLDALLMLLNMIDSPSVGLLLDVWEVFAGGGSMEAIRKIPTQQIVAVQIAEMAAATPLSELDEKSRLLPDAEGRIGVPAILTYLGRTRLRRSGDGEAVAQRVPESPPRQRGEIHQRIARPRVARGRLADAAAAVRRHGEQYAGLDIAHSAHSHATACGTIRPRLGRVNESQH